MKAATTNLTILLLAGSLAALASPAAADIVKFYSGTTGYTGPFNGLGTVYDATFAAATNCPTQTGPGTCPTGDVISTTQNYTSTSVAITATATGGTTGQVYGDFQPAFGGLGVNSAIDQIDGNEVLHLHFASAVLLNGIGTLFSA